jgi:hypothetical protein
MDQDPRAKELVNLKLSLATFALQLDAFERRLRTQSFEAAKPETEFRHGVEFATAITSAMRMGRAESSTATGSPPVQ